MELTTLYKQYRAAKLAADQAAKEEDKLKKALKKAMEEAGVKNYTDEDGFLFERIVQNRKSMDESMIWMYMRYISWMLMDQEETELYFAKERAVSSVKLVLSHSLECSCRWLILMRKTKRNSSSSGREVSQTLSRS